MRNDDMHRWLGAEVTGSVGFKPSHFQLTENERQLRDLAYPLIEPPRSRPAWKSVFGDYQPLPSPWRQKVVFDRTTYGRALIDEPHRSHTSRYQQLIEDVRNDITRFEPFFASAMHVIELDPAYADPHCFLDRLDQQAQVTFARVHPPPSVRSPRVDGSVAPDAPHDRGVPLRRRSRLRRWRP